MNFLFFVLVRFVSTQLTSSPPFPLHGAASPTNVAMSHFFSMEPRQAHGLRFIFRQHFIWSSPLSSRNQSIEYAPSLPPSPDCPTPTLHCYKNIISTPTTLPNTQPCLYFISSLARAPCHQSSTCYSCSLSMPSYGHHPSAQ
jgi:hypothetical protein